MFRWRRGTSPQHYRYNRRRCSSFAGENGYGFGHCSLLCLNTLGRLRPALYFFFSLALMTFIYCLLFSDQPSSVGGLFRTSTFVQSITKGGRINDAGHASPKPTTVMTREEDFEMLLDEMKSYANRHYLDDLTPHEIQLLGSNDKLDASRYDLNSLSEQSDSANEPARINATNGSKADEDEEDLNRDSLERMIHRLGFDLEHIYKHNVRMNATLETGTADRNSILSHAYNMSQKWRAKHYRFYATLPEFITLNNTLVVVTAVGPNQLNLGLGFVRSFELFRRSLAARGSNSSIALLIYDLGLDDNHLLELQTLCNASHSFVHYRKFTFTDYASHVSNLRIGAYRSIVMQEVLRDIRHACKSSSRDHRINLFWLDVHYWFANGSSEIDDPVKKLLEQSGSNVNIRAWPMMQPTSSLTHQRMFEFFHTNAESFYFHHMIRSGQLLVSVDEKSWTHFESCLMLPWVHCALNADCIAPIGSQYRSACSLDKKPHYRYSGCHHYDMSALNVVLGLAFDFSSGWYSMHQDNKFFVSILDLLNTQAWQAFVMEQAGVVREEHSTSAGWDNVKIQQFMFDVASHNVTSTHAPPQGSVMRLDYIPSDDDLPVQLTLATVP